MSDWYDWDGRPISVERAAQIRDEREPHVAKATVEYGSGTVDVSTVWLGLDHNYLSGPPLVFETMVFGGPKGVDQWCERYPTQEAAQAGHDRVVTALKIRDLSMFEITADEVEHPQLTQKVRDAGRGMLYAVDRSAEGVRDLEVIPDWDEAARGMAELSISQTGSGRLVYAVVDVGPWRYAASDPRGTPE